MSDVVISADELRKLATGALVAGGMVEEDARKCAEVLVLADMFGLRTHGISRVSQYLDRVRVGGIDPRATVEVTKVAPGLALVNGNNGIGPLIGMKALDAVLGMAKDVGIAAAFVRGSNHFGPIIPYAFIGAEAGMATIIASNATTTIAPFGGRDTRVGNNPMGIGVPSPKGTPVILDLAMSVAARAKIRQLLKAQKPIPADWATDKDGKPTTDPAAALDGFLLPFGGHKGYGLAVMMDMLTGLLSGAAYLTHVQAWDKNPEAAQNLGHFFIAIDVSRLGPSDWLEDRMNDFKSILRGTPPADPAAPVMLPGDREMAAYHRQKIAGVSVARVDYEAICSLA